MARSNEIRWRESDLKELQKAVRNQRLKTKRLNNLGVSTEYEPLDYQTFKNRKESIKTRKEFNDFIKEVKKFTSRKNEIVINQNGFAMGTKTQVANIKKLVKKKNELSKDYREKYSEEKIKIDNIEQDSTLFDVQMRKVEQYNKAKNKNRLKSQKEIEFREISMDEYDFKDLGDWERFAKRMTQQSKQSYYNEKEQLWIDNYKSGIEHAFNSSGDDIISIMDKILENNKQDVIKQFYLEKFAEIDFIYDKTDEGGTHDKILDMWKNYAEELGVSLE